MAWSRNCCGTDTSNATPQPQPYRARSVPTYRLGHIRSRRGISPGSLRQTLRRAYRGPGGASSYGGDGTMNEKREERTKEMAEELSRLQQIHAHLAALEQMAASYPENHSTRLAIESLELYKARTVVEGDIVTLRGSLGYGTTGYGTL